MSLSSNSSTKKKEIHQNGVVRGKSARACDNCVKKRARWYCGADDAFLCRNCDASVHSANSLARRHHRLPLKPSSSHKPPLPTWHRKPRTPRNHSSNKHAPPLASSRAVPELCGDDHDDVVIAPDEHLLYRVPIFDPLVAELCTTTTTTSTAKNDDNIKNSIISYDNNIGAECCPKEEAVAVVVVSPSSEENSMQFGALPTEMDLAEFAADVESLLGRGLEEECDFGMEGLGFVDFHENELSCSDGRVKIEFDQLQDHQHEEQEEMKIMNVNMKMWPEPLFQLNLEDYEEESEEEENSKSSELSGTQAKTEPELLEEDEEKEKWSKTTKTKKKKKILLSLDYEGVIEAWASQGSPWTTGARPDFDPDRDACWPADTVGTYNTQFQNHHHYVDLSGVVRGTTPAILLDGGREARVLRYREKRRTRLFEKKIRYEVRKLNAEKRPRMKGRFVKRASFGVSSFPMLK